MYDRKVVRRRRAVLAVFVGAVDRDPDRLLRRVRRRLLPRVPARRPGGVLADRDGRQPRAQAGARPVRLGRRHVRRQEGEQGPEEGGRSACAASSPSRRPPQRDADQLKALVGLTARAGLPAGDEAGHRARDRAARRRSGTRRIKIDKGSSDGIATAGSQPVIDRPGGLVGKVTSVTGGTAEVTLITDASSGVSARRSMPVGRHRGRAARGRQPARPAAGVRRGRPRDREHDRRHLRLHDREGASRCSRAASRSAG